MIASTLISHHTDTDVMDIDTGSFGNATMSNITMKPLSHQLTKIKFLDDSNIYNLGSLFDHMYTQPSKTDKQTVYQICIPCFFFFYNK